MVEDGGGSVANGQEKKKDGKKSQNDGRRTLKGAKKSIQFIIVCVALITYTHTSHHASRCQNRAFPVV